MWIASSPITVRTRSGMFHSGGNCLIKSSPHPLCVFITESIKYPLTLRWSALRVRPSWRGTWRERQTITIIYHKIEITGRWIPIEYKRIYLHDRPLCFVLAPPKKRETCRKSPVGFVQPRKTWDCLGVTFFCLSYDISTQLEKKPQADKSSSSCSRISKEELRVIDLSLTAHMLYVWCRHLRDFDSSLR